MHDVMIHTYGANVTIASLHVEVDASGDIMALHDTVDHIEKRLYEEHQIFCTIHMDPIITDDERVTKLKNMVIQAVKEIDERLNIHDFRFVEGPTHTNLIFDLVVPFEIQTDLSKIRQMIDRRINQFDGTYYAVITFDRA